MPALRGGQVASFHFEVKVQDYAMSCTLATTPDEGTVLKQQPMFPYTSHKEWAW